MNEYTLLALASAAGAVVLDHLAGVRLTRRKAFWVFMAVMFGFKIVVNGYLTGRPIVLYGEQFFSGIRLGTIPAEDFFYGFGLITVAIVSWEYFIRPRTSRGKEERS